MPLEQIASNVYAIPLGFVNAYLVQGTELVLVDTGIPGSADAILGAVRELGKEPHDIKHILVTHLHPDHTGSLAALKRETGAPAYMHPLDAAAVRIGQGGRPSSPTPGAPPEVLEMLKQRQQMPIKLEAAEIEFELNEGDELPFLPGAHVLHAPGHTAGQLVFILPADGGVLIAADTSGNVTTLEYAPIYEDFELGKTTLQKLARLEFAVACFGHGKAIPRDASARFREKWG